MELNFAKYHGAGNDFILLDGRQVPSPLPAALIARLCHRHFGIGADGLIILYPAKDIGADYRMAYFNADGYPSSMCGNGARCAFIYARSVDLAGDQAVFHAYDGLHSAEETHQGYVRISMSDVHSIEIPEPEVRILNTGSPHYVRFVDDLAGFDAFEEGRKVRRRPEFLHEGINVNFVRISPDHVLHVRTYERGVESLTLACGTGVTAAALAYADKQGLSQGKIRVLADGGELSVEFIRKGDTFTRIFLSGPVEKVFIGKIRLQENDLTGELS